MGTHYLFDAHGTGAVTSAKLRDVRRGVSSSPIRGEFVVRVSDDLTLVGDPPANYLDLLTEKYNAILAFYPSFGNLQANEMSSSPAIDPTPGTGRFGVHVGQRGTVRVNQNGGFFRTTTFALFSPPAQFVLTWEVYRIALDDNRDNLSTRIYEEVPSSFLGAAVSLDAGANFSSVSDGAVFNTVFPGSTLVVRFGNASLTDPVWLGSWALVY